MEAPADAALAELFAQAFAEAGVGQTVRAGVLRPSPTTLR
jgi:hypothetical protein